MKEHRYEKIMLGLFDSVAKHRDGLHFGDLIRRLGEPFFHRRPQASREKRLPVLAQPIEWWL